MNIFTNICQEFCLLFRNIYLKGHLLVAPSVCFYREEYFKGNYYSQEYLNLKIPHCKLFQGKYLFTGGVVISKYIITGEYFFAKSTY